MARTADPMLERSQAVAQAAVWGLLQDAYDAADAVDEDPAALGQIPADVADDWGAGGYRSAMTAGEQVRGAMGAAAAQQLLVDPDAGLGEEGAQGAYLMFMNPADSSTSLLCAQFIEPSVVLPAGHPFWVTHSPPLHPNCRSWLVGLSEDEARAMGVTTNPPDYDADDGYGSPGGYYGYRPVEDAYEVAQGDTGGPPVEWGE